MDMQKNEAAEMGASVKDDIDEQQQQKKVRCVYIWKISKHITF